MAESTGISWCDSTLNPWLGCTKVSPACDHCYAERLMDHRMHRVHWGAGEPRVRTSAANWKQPARWNAKRFMRCEDCGWRGEAESAIVGCGACGSIELSDTRRRVFCASLADVFDNEVPEQWRADLFRLIEATPNLDWLLLTKRIGNAAQMMFMARGGHLPLLPNVWLGATICNQAEADRDIPKLLATPARVRFLSIEPMLGPVDLTRIKLPLRGESFETANVLWRKDSLQRGAARASIDWVICGGESGPQARPMHPDWARSLRDQCSAAGVPFHFKQWGEWAPRPVGRVHDSYRWPIHPGEPEGGIWSYRITGAGRWLDGIEHNGTPACSPLSQTLR